MAIITRAQNADYDRGWAETFGKKEDSGFVAYPKELPPRYNGGVLCDMWIGPCACGATHVKAEYPPESYEP